MNKIEQHPERWEKIERYLNGEMTDAEKQDFEKQMEQNQELAEMVAFSQAIDTREAYNNLEFSEADERRREELLKDVSENERLADHLAWHQMMSILPRRQQLLQLLDTLDNPAEPQPDPTPSDTGFWNRHWKPVLAGTFALLLAGVFLITRQQSSVDPFPDVPDYSITFLDELAGEKEAFETGNYALARKRFNELRLDLQQSLEYDPEMLHILDFYIALTDLRLGNIPAARRRLERVVIENPNLYGQPEQLFLGLIYYQQGDYAQAREWLEKAADSNGFLEGKIPISEVAKRFLTRLEDS